MTGLQLLQWLEAIPRQELDQTQVILELGRLDENTLVTAKYYRGTPESPQPQPTIYLIHK